MPSSYNTGGSKSYPTGHASSIACSAPYANPNANAGPGASNNAKASKPAASNKAAGFNLKASLSAPPSSDSPSPLSSSVPNSSSGTTETLKKQITNSTNYNTKFEATSNAAPTKPSKAIHKNPPLPKKPPLSTDVSVLQMTVVNLEQIIEKQKHELNCLQLQLQFEKNAREEEGKKVEEERKQYSTAQNIKRGDIHNFAAQNKRGDANFKFDSKIIMARLIC
jgi:hypothetical protein